MRPEDRMYLREKCVFDRAIDLTPDEMQRCRRAMRGAERIKRMIFDLMNEALEEQADREEDMRHECAVRAGFNSLQELHAAGYSITLDYATNQLKIFKKVEPKTESA